MNSIRFFIWIMRRKVFDVNEEGNIKKEGLSRKEKQKFILEISMCMLMPVYLCKIIYMKYMHVY